ncbi:hypothetical protein [Paenibacillus sp. XY044]|uniref:hypothetical protein n=1 Tax=Paenibacillus sp. XY044 TaxID=2026089 RepID=UPI000B992555|nr:hypothetical protein [Paenibacillus sp. XY044]OZB90074.1 hypothetical protein CJP46_35435 [Paenibacillus sp. XY044]
MSIQELEQKVEELRYSIHSEYQRGAMRDEDKIADLQQQLDDLTQQLDVEQRLAQHEERVEENQTQIAYILDNLTVEDVSMRELCNNEAAYQLLRTVVQQTMMDREEKLLSEIKSTKDQLDAAKTERDNTQKQYDEMYEVSAQQVKEIANLKAELEDTERKRDAAAAELDEAKAEIARLNSQVDDLRKEIAVGAVNAVQVVDVKDALDNYKKQKQLDEASKPAIYDVQQTDLKGSTFTAKLAETNEQITFGWIERNKYKEVTAQEAEVFRAEYLARQAEKETERNQDDLALGSGAVVIPTDSQFQKESESQLDGVDQGDTDGALETEAAGSVAERLQALEQRVTLLEQQALTKGEAA